MADPERAALLDRIRQLERAASPLEPGAADRQRLRDAVVGSSERFPSRPTRRPRTRGSVCCEI